MQFFKYALVFAICFALLDPTEGGWGRRAWRKLKKAGKKIVKAVKKPICKVLYGVVCPVGVTAAGAAISTSTSGVGDFIVGAAVAAGNRKCRVKKEKCKRSVSTNEVMYPFSDVFSDYDINEDKKISFYELVITVMTSVKLEDPGDLLGPFLFADVDGDENLNTEEFIGAPFFFAHPSYEILNSTSTAA